MLGNLLHQQCAICLSGLSWRMIGLVMGDDSKCPVSGKRKYDSEGEALATAAHQIATTHAPKDLSAYGARDFSLA